MSVRASGSGNLLKEKWDKVVAASGFAILVLVVCLKFLMAGGEEQASFVSSSAVGKKAAPEIEGVIDTLSSIDAVNAVDSIDDKKKTFLSSQSRVSCFSPDKHGCGLPILMGAEKCRWCQASQTKEITEVTDTDGDGFLDKYELEHGLDVNSDDTMADKDGDGFTNMEEFVAKTSPSDAKDHPDYLDSLKLRLPFAVKTTELIFERTETIHGKLRYVFNVPGRDKEHDRGVIRVYENDDIAIVNEYTKKVILDTGFVARGLERKTVPVKMGGGMIRQKPADEVTIERKSDGKKIKLVLEKKTPTPTDIEATLVLERGGTMEFSVIEGAEIDIRGAKYKVLNITQGKGKSSVTLKNTQSGYSKAIEALEQ